MLAPISKQPATMCKYTYSSSLQSVLYCSFSRYNFLANLQQSSLNLCLWGQSGPSGEKWGLETCMCAHTSHAWYKLHTQTAGNNHEVGGGETEDSRLDTLYHLGWNKARSSSTKDSWLAKSKKQKKNKRANLNLSQAQFPYHLFQC